MPDYEQYTDIVQLISNEKNEYNFHQLQENFKIEIEKSKYKNHWYKSYYDMKTEYKSIFKFKENNHKEKEFTKQKANQAKNNKGKNKSKLCAIFNEDHYTNLCDQFQDCINKFKQSKMETTNNVKDKLTKINKKNKPPTYTLNVNVDEIKDGKTYCEYCENVEQNVFSSIFLLVMSSKTRILLRDFI